MTKRHRCPTTGRANGDGGEKILERDYAQTLDGWLQSLDYQQSLGITHVAMESTGKRHSDRRRKGNQRLFSVLLEVAWAAARTRGTYLAALYHRIAARWGKKRAIVAVAHAILVIVYYIIQRKEPYQELGGNYFDQQNPEATAKRLVKRLQKLGYQVSLQAQGAGVAV